MHGCYSYLIFDCALYCIYLRSLEQYTQFYTFCVSFMMVRRVFLYYSCGQKEFCEESISTYMSVKGKNREFCNIDTFSRICSFCNVVVCCTQAGYQGSLYSLRNTSLDYVHYASTTAEQPCESHVSLFVMEQNSCKSI